jgi:PleD family two-component response regulator
MRTIDNIVRSCERQIHGFKSESGISATRGLLAMNDMNLAPSSTFIGRVLLVSDDAIAVEQLSESMQRFALSVEHCTEVSSALERLKRSKFEAVIVDFQIGSQAGTVLQETRQSASNEHAVLFSVSDNQAETTDAFKAGSTFVLRRSLRRPKAMRSCELIFGRCSYTPPSSGMTRLRGHGCSTSGRCSP